MAAGGEDSIDALGDLAQRGAAATATAASFAPHEPLWPQQEKRTAYDHHIAGLIAEQHAMLNLGEASGLPGRSAHGSTPAAQPAFAHAHAHARTANIAAKLAVLENDFLKVFIDSETGIEAVLDKGTGKNFSFKHELFLYKSNETRMAAYDFQPAGPATSIGPKMLATTVSLGSVMQEARFQVRRCHPKAAAGVPTVRWVCVPCVSTLHA